MSADVAIRLGLKGGTEVERGLKQVGREGKVALKELQDAARGLPPHMAAVSRGVGAVRDAVQNLAQRAPGAIGAVAGSFGFLGTAIAAVTAAVGLMAVAMVRGAVAAANTGDEIAALANKVGVSTTALQQLRDAGLEADVEIGEMDAGLQGLNAALGAMKSGVGDAKLKEAFDYLQFTPEQLAGFRDASDLLPVLADRLALVSDKAERVQLAKKLGAENLLPFLELGSARIRELMQAASDGGRVINPGLVNDLAAADRQMEKTDARLKAVSTTFFGQFSPAVASSKDGLADMLIVAGAVPGAIGAVGKQADKDAGKLLNMADAARVAVNALLQLANVPFRVGRPSANQAAPPMSAAQMERIDWSKFRSDQRTATPGTATAAAVAAWRKANPDPKPAASGGSRGESAASARKRAEAEAERAAELAKQNAERLRALDLENRLALARATANADLIKKLEDEVALYALIARYQAAGVDADTARLAAQIQLRELKRMEAETVKVDANPEGFQSSDERMADIGPVDLSTGTDWTVLRDRFKTSFRDGVRQALETGDLGGALAAQVENAFIDGVSASLDRLADMLFDLFEQAVRGQSTAGAGGDMWDQLAGFIGGAIGGGVSTGGSVSAHAGASSGRATGGPVYRGWSGLVGEQGRERFTAAADGYIADAATTARQMTDARARPAASSERGSGGAGGGGEAVTVNLNNQTSTPMQARATERRDPATGGRHLDVELFDMIDARIDQRFKSSLRGRRDDSDWAGQFGIRRRLTGG